MDVLEYCQSNHLRDDINDLDLHLRLCRFCRMAMCEACFDVHKNHCSGQTESNKRNSNNMASTCEGPELKKSRRYQPLENRGSSYLPPVNHSLAKTTQPGNTHTYPKCQVHSLSEDQFCMSHCTLVCQRCGIEHHTTCTMKPVAVVCESLDETTVTEYKKWLNNLRVSGIELKQMLSRNLESVDKSKLSALDDLQTKFSKANENLNTAFRDTKSEIETSFDTQFSEMWQKISKIDAINDKLENSLSDSGVLEGSRMDVKLFLKLFNIISKYNNRALSDDMKTLCEGTKKVKCSFVANIRFQPLSPRSNLGHVNRIATRISNISPVSTTDLSQVFSKLSNGRSAGLSTRTEKVYPNKSTENQTTLISGEAAVSVHGANNSDTSESEAIRKDFTARETGQYASGNANKTNTRQNDSLTPDDYENCNLNDNKKANGFRMERTGFPIMFKNIAESREENVRESSANKQNSSAKIIKIQAPTVQNKNNVVLLQGSPHVLVPYNTVSFSDGKNGNKQGNIQLANMSGYSNSSIGVTSERSSHDLREQVNLLGNNHNKIDHTPQSTEQSSLETRSGIHVNLTGYKNAQTATSAGKTYGSIISYKSKPCVPKLQENDQDSSLQATCALNIAEKSICQPDNAVESDNVTCMKGNFATSEAAIAGTAGELNHVSMATNPLHHENASSNSAVIRNQRIISDRQDIGTANDNLSNVLNDPKPPIECTQPSTEIREHVECSKLWDLLEKTNNNCLSSQAIDNSIARDKSRKSCTNSNIAERDRCVTFTDQEATRKAYTNANLIEFRHSSEGSGNHMLNINAVENSKTSFLDRINLNNEALCQFSSNNYPKSNDVIISTEVTQPSIERKQRDNGCSPNFQALLEVASSLAHSSHLKEAFEANDSGQGTYNSSNAGDMTGNFGSTLREINGTGVISNYTRQQCEKSESRMPRIKEVEYCKSDSLYCPDSNTRSFEEPSSNLYNNTNGAMISSNDPMISNNNPSYFSSLQGTSRTPTEIAINSKGTPLLKQAFEIEHNKKMLFTELNVTSVSQKNVRMESDRYPPDTYGCVFMPDERVVLCDRSNNKIKLLDKSFTLQDSLDLPSKPWDIAVVNDTTVIITLPCKKQLQYIEVTPKLKIGRVLQLDKKCWGVNVVGSDIYVTCSDYPRGDGEVRIVDKNGKVKNRHGVNQDKTFMFTLPYNIAVSALSNKIYISDLEQDTVTCLRSDGTVIYQYKNAALRSPGGLCVDDEDNVIVCGGMSHNIHIVTAAGEKRSVFLTSNDGVEYPHCVAYRRTDHTMIVGSFLNDNLFVINCAEK